MINKSVGAQGLALRCFVASGALALAGAAAATQLSISSGSVDKPHLMCKAWTGDSSTSFASGQVTNQPNAIERFSYHARKYGEQLGKQIYTDCVDFELISDKYRNSFTPGATHQNYRGETRNVIAATFLPPNWESTPTPEEKGQKAGKEDNRAAPTSESAAPTAQAAAAKYVEVAGPDGKIIRLSPEVAARNKAAEEEYQRKIEAHAEVIAQAERDAAKHAQSVANAAAEKREYERQLAANAAQVAAHKAKMENYNKSPTLAGGSEHTFQATSKFRATREEAMYEMTSHPRAPISNVQCKEVTFYKPARWTCWGTYQQAVSQSSTSKQ